MKALLFGALLLSAPPEQSLEIEEDTDPFSEIQQDFVVKTTLRWQVDNGESSRFFNTLNGGEAVCQVNEDCPLGQSCFDGLCRTPNPEFDPTGENFGDFLTTFGGTFRWRSWSATTRFDTALYYRPPTASEEASDFIRERLRSRYENQFQAEYLSLTYSDRDVEFTIGDYYVTLGRGMALAVRIADEVGVDNKLRGGEAKAHVGPLDFHFFYGFLNIKNFEAGTGFIYEDANDRMGGGRIEFSPGKYLKIGLHGSSILTPEVNGVTTEILSAGGTVEFPRLVEWASAYFEGVFMDRTQWVGPGQAPLDQEAVGFYGNINFFFGDLTLLAEGKIYDNMFNILPNDGAGDLADRQLINRVSEPPNAERFGATILTNSTVFGGRLRADYNILAGDLRLVPYASFGRYQEGGCGLFGYRGRAGATDGTPCDDSGPPTNNVGPRSFANAVFGGLRVTWGPADLSLEGGYRGQFYHESQFQNSDEISEILFQETHIELDSHLTLGEFSTELYFLGKSLADVQLDWVEGRVAFTLGHDSGWSVTPAFEYSNISPNSRENYPSISGQWQVNDVFLLRALIGGERPGLKCSGGACRFFPGFEGVRFELTARF